MPSISSLIPSCLRAGAVETGAAAAPKSAAASAETSASLAKHLAADGATLSDWAKNAGRKTNPPKNVAAAQQRQYQRLVRNMPLAEIAGKGKAVASAPPPSIARPSASAAGPSTSAPERTGIAEVPSRSPSPEPRRTPGGGVPSDSAGEIHAMGGSTAGKVAAFSIQGPPALSRAPIGA